MDPDPQSAGHAPEYYREFLCRLARLRLDPRLQGKVDVEGLANEAMMEAYQAGSVFSAMAEHEQKLWLRRVLLHRLMNAVRALRQKKRDVEREQILEAVIEDSSVRLENLLAIEDSTPSKKAQQNELELQLEEALATLVPQQREAVVLRHYHSWPVAQISEHMKLSNAAVAGLLHRALTNLRGFFPTE